MGCGGETMVQSLEKPRLSIGVDTTAPWLSWQGLSTFLHTLLHVLLCYNLSACPGCSHFPGASFMGGKLGSHCCRSCQALSLQLWAPGSSLSSSQCSSVQETRAAHFGALLGHLRNHTYCAPQEMKESEFLLSCGSSGRVPLPVASVMASVSEGSSSKDTCHTQTATKQDAKDTHAPGLIQQQPKHPSLLLARHEGSECLKGYLTLCRTRPT